MRHPGVHISGDQATWSLRDERGLETVSWLTLVGREPLDRLGGAEAARRKFAPAASIRVIDLVHGLLVQAGDRALVGDLNRGDNVPLYRQVYAALENVIEPVVRDTRPLLVTNDLEDEDEMTMRWLRRFVS